MMGGGAGDFGGCCGGGKKGKGKSNGKETVLGPAFGAIKAFYPEKGYGFIACPDAAAQGLSGDVYMHGSQNSQGFEVGTQIKFTLYLFNGRPQSRDIELLAPGEGGEGAMDAFGGGGGACGGGGGINEQQLGTFMGRMKAFNHEKGFGFIES